MDLEMNSLTVLHQLLDALLPDSSYPERPGADLGATFSLIVDGCWFVHFEII